MITDARFLNVETVPSRDIFVHRNAELTAISSALDPVEDSSHGPYVILSGPPGSGKSAVAGVLLQELRHEMLPVKTQTVNCWRDHATGDTLFEILTGTGLSFGLSKDTAPHSKMLQRLEEQDDQPFVLVLDEVDQLADLSVLYSLYRMSHVSLVLITNDEQDLFARFDSRLQSRFCGGTHVTMNAYSVPELTDILQKRVEAGLNPGVITTPQLERIADEVAGDARLGVQTLREAARLALDKRADQITDEIVKDAIPMARATVRKRRFDDLTYHQQMLYEIVIERTEVRPGELYTEYCSRVRDPRSRRTMRRYMKKLEHYNMVERIGKKRGRRYRLAPELMPENLPDSSH